MAEIINTTTLEGRMQMKKKISNKEQENTD